MRALFSQPSNALASNLPFEIWWTVPFFNHAIDFKGVIIGSMFFKVANLGVLLGRSLLIKLGANAPLRNCHTGYAMASTGLTVVKPPLSAKATSQIGLGSYKSFSSYFLSQPSQV